MNLPKIKLPEMDDKDVAIVGLVIIAGCAVFGDPSIHVVGLLEKIAIAIGSFVTGRVWQKKL